MKTSMFLKMAEIRKKYNYPQSSLDNPKGEIPFYTTDCNKVEARTKLLSLKKAKGFVESINKKNKLKNIPDRITLEDIFCQKEIDENRIVRKIIDEMNNDVNFEENYLALIDFLNTTEFFSVELIINMALGNIFYFKNDFLMSIKYYEENLSFYVETKSFKEIDEICRRIAFFYHRLNQSNKAVLLHEQIRNLIDKLEHKDIIKLNIGICFEKIGYYQRAIKIFEEIEFFEENIKTCYIDVQVEKALCLIGLEKYNEAEKIYLELEKRKDPQEVKFGKTNRGELYAIQKDKEKLIKIYDEIKKYALYDKIDKNMELDYKYRTIKILDFMKMDDFLNIEENYNSCILKMLEIGNEELSFITEKTEIIKLYLQKAHSKDIMLVNKIIEHIFEKENYYDLKDLTFYIIDYFSKFDYFKEIKELYINLKKHKIGGLEL